MATKLFGRFLDTIWRPYHIIVGRKVTEEESVTVECFYKTQEQCEDDLTRFLGVFRDHRKRTNEEVVRATQQQLAALDTAITAKGDETHRLDAEIEKKRIEHKNLELMLKNQRRRLGSVEPVVCMHTNGKADNIAAVQTSSDVLLKD
jgi:hypothetical protein